MQSNHISAGMWFTTGSVLLMLLLTVLWIPGGTAKASIISIAQCRSRCLSKFVKNDVSDGACITNSSCDSCWNACQTIFSNYAEFWQETCKQRALCKRGCRVACQFKKSPPPVIVSGDEWQFSQTPAVSTDKYLHDMFIVWTRPVPRNTSSGPKEPPVPLVYLLLARDAKKNDKSWQEVKQTASTDAMLRLFDLPASPEFWLLAVDENGTRTQIKFQSDINLPWTDEDVRFTNKFQARKGGSASISVSSESKFNITMETVVKDGRLEPIIHWKNPTDVPHSASYKVDIYLKSCECGFPPEHFQETVPVDMSQQPKLQLKEINFNAVYTITVQLDSVDSWHGRLDYQTPVCNDTELDDPTQCKSNTDTALQVKVLTTTTPAGHYVEEVEDGQQIRYPAVDQGESMGLGTDWNITVDDIRYDPDTEHVHVKLRWQTLPLHHVTHEINWANEDHKYVADAGRKKLNTTVVGTDTVATLVLKPNIEYKVYIIASGTQANEKKLSVRSRDTVICTNITDNMAHVYASRVSASDKEKDILGGIIVGVTVVASLIIVGIIVLFVYKKRQSFRDIMLTKTAVAKSNSYKSNVGCKGDYSNQMLITSDDWEIDCRQLKFASHIGQGAFGKVVTGYYKDQRVAIKLVRDCAPLSYKEDLLAELNLMKRLGSHPNIVSMIGAVTVMEPICLVMEYAPYGNLQNFLKRCRLEGELCVNGGKSPTLNYSLMDEHGGINEGIITPADLLSFARQVSMAMEYLGEKKYVHRDLAARNVLLGNDKIIKVCDFGLSRDIYNDNQYKKLTNGKLPLKWMAIESLRDRIFTTQSDVWSFGILLWEIVTMGASPYPNIALADLYYLLSNHYRMEKPSNCSDELYIIMRQCWLETPSDRPNFTDLRVQLELLLSRDRNYLELDNINVPLSTPESSSGSPVSDDTASLLAAQALQPHNTSKDELTVDVCIHDKSPHDKSVEMLLKRKGEFDAHNITIL